MIHIGAIECWLAHADRTRLLESLAQDISIVPRTRDGGNWTLGLYKVRLVEGIFRLRFLECKGVTTERLPQEFHASIVRF
jgi:hypothetical protein